MIAEGFKILASVLFYACVLSGAALFLVVRRIKLLVLAALLGGLYGILAWWLLGGAK